jgi:hypothetical protein
MAGGANSPRRCGDRGCRRDALRQLVQTYVGVVAMEQKLANPTAALSGGWGAFRPFGTYVMCSPEGVVCVDNPTAVLYATSASRCSRRRSPRRRYTPATAMGDLVVKMP